MEANENYSKADSILKKKLSKCFKILQISPRDYPQIKPLKGEFAGKYRFRVGDYRVIYTIDDQKSEVIILLIIHRSQAYR
ncbi:Plasmid stabilization system [Crocosphaera watsonii WH 0402]|uniref:Plasmid stabilization system n=4 Tax=Aphanothecaceae TaxID=1890450 RepID=T2JWL2_CROWT|nr:hypothetical protein CWATWH0003_4863 [Crocosphaera watsonii WH 0003]CCQ56620.1 Plasmid stabilization system [Crocosphaera watsonii WH 0005]CCQ69605.1 Plasmid stabilization system [Crocosphaera watsonii WH 0402]